MARPERVARVRGGRERRRRRPRHAAAPLPRGLCPLPAHELTRFFSFLSLSCFRVPGNLPALPRRSNTAPPRCYVYEYLCPEVVPWRWHFSLFALYDLSGPLPSASRTPGLVITSSLRLTRATRESAKSSTTSQILGCFTALFLLPERQGSALSLASCGAKQARAPSVAPGFSETVLLASILGFLDRLRARPLCL